MIDQYGYWLFLNCKIFIGLKMSIYGIAMLFKRGFSTTLCGAKGGERCKRYMYYNTSPP